MRWNQKELLLLQQLNLKSILENRNFSQTMTAGDLYDIDSS